jgi:hypothetical protein
MQRISGGMSGGDDHQRSIAIEIADKIGEELTIKWR